MSTRETSRRARWPTPGLHLYVRPCVTSVQVTAMAGNQLSNFVFSYAFRWCKILAVILFRPLLTESELCIQFHPTPNHYIYISARITSTSFLNLFSIFLPRPSYRIRIALCSSTRTSYSDSITVKQLDNSTFVANATIYKYGFLLEALFIHICE